MAFHWSLSSSKFSLVSRTILSILADLSNDVVCMVSIVSLIFHSTNLFSKHLKNVPSEPPIIGITDTFSSQARSKYLSILGLNLVFTLWSTGIAKSNR